jgi:tRNA-splicing ligase RtcB
VRGKGHADGLKSCQHEAGRVIGHGEAVCRFTPADHHTPTEGIECLKGKDVIDEPPRPMSTSTP